jgi:hypothetical protein
VDVGGADVESFPASGVGVVGELQRVDGVGFRVEVGGLL